LLLELLLLLLLLLQHKLLLLLGKSSLLHLQLVVTSLLQRIYRTLRLLLSRWLDRCLLRSSGWHGLERCLERGLGSWLESGRRCAERSAYCAGFKSLKLSEDSLMDCLDCCPTFCTHPHF
jgi:hypothetical protein